jgi:hypothetical protein
MGRYSISNLPPSKFVAFDLSIRTDRRRFFHSFDLVSFSNGSFNILIRLLPAPSLANYPSFNRYLQQLLPSDYLFIQFVCLLSYSYQHSSHFFHSI